MHERIAFVKTGWSDEYKGGDVLGRYAHIAKHGDPHERFNFLSTSSGEVYGYLPPIGAKERPPQPKINTGWLLIFVSARMGNGPLTVVGWYEDATFEKEYRERPDYRDVDHGSDRHGARYGYCISAKNAFLIPTADRTVTISGSHFKRSSILYVRGNGKDELWRKELAQKAETVYAEYKENIETLPPKLVFPDQAHRKAVEIASISYAKEFLKEYRIEDRQKDNCGYDLLAVHHQSGEELHVEVKGTSGVGMHFYMSRKEYRYMPNPQWRLIMVTSALTKPTLKLMNRAEVNQIFELEPFAWEGKNLA